MDKKLRLSILYVVLLSLLIGGAILFSKPKDKSRDTSQTIYDENSNAPIVDNNRESITAYKNEIKNETISVFNNGSDIDLRANLIEDKSGQVSLRLTYKLKGKLISKTIDTSNLKEIRNIFRFREEYGSGYRLNNMVLNKKMNKLYFCVEGRKDENYSHTSIYSYGLKNSKIERIFYNIGTFSSFYLSPEESYNAFSYYEKQTSNVNNNDKAFVVIIRCQDNKLVLNGNRDIKGKQLGKNQDLYAYEYNFINWHSNNTCILEQRATIKDGSQKISKQTVFYDLTTNELTVIPDD